MKRSLGSVLSLVVLLGGCGQATTETVVDEYSTVLSNVADELESVQSASQANDVAAKITSMADDVDRLSQKAETSNKTDVSKEASERATQQANRIKSAITRITKSGAMTEALQAALQKMDVGNQVLLASAKAGKLP